MEDIYTIKIKSNPDPRSLYPSERRYSASTVLGLGVVHLALAATILLLASLSLSNSADVSKPLVNVSKEVLEERNDDVAFLDEDDIHNEQLKIVTNVDNSDVFLSLTIAPCIMAIGAIAAGITGLLAWKRWYIDHNIRWFFFMSAISVITALICFVTNCLSVGEMIEQRSTLTKNTFVFSFNENNVVVDRVRQESIKSQIFSKSQTGAPPNLRLVLAINILIASVLELIWSVMSTKVSFFGMRNNYPDDIILSRGKIEVNTVHKGNKSGKTVAPDILNHHPKKRKFVKYFPKIENGFLPKQESNNEYRDRVNKFLSTDIPHSEC